MSSSTSPDSTARSTLHVQTDHPAAEVFLLDSHLQLTARGVGSLVTQQVPGVYKVRVRLGREFEEKLILLDGDTTERISAPPFASAAPLEATTLMHESHAAAAEAHSERPTVVLGDGASIFVLARYFTMPGRQAEHQRNPARDLVLRDFDGNLLVDLASASVSGGPPDAWAACHVQLAPGAYVLEGPTSQGPLASTVIASPGWQTQVFLIRSAPRAVSDAEAGGTPPTGTFAMGTVLMSSGPFRSGSADRRLTELASIALADERPILVGALRELLLRTFTNPMQGILGAHLMLLARNRSSTPVRRSDAPARPAVPDPDEPFDPQLFESAVSRLRSMVGPAHPDVEALSLQCADPGHRAGDVFTVPPMLRRSWSLIVEASNDRPSIVDPNLWNRVMARTMTAPFLSWSTSDRVRRQFQESMREAVGRSRSTAHPPQPRVGATPDGAFEGFVARSIAPSAPVPEPDEVRRGLSLGLDIPRGAVDRLFGE